MQNSIITKQVITSWTPRRRATVSFQLVFFVAVILISSAANGQWTSNRDENPMDGTISCFASSPQTFPLREMSFPYGDVWSSIVAWETKTLGGLYFYFSSLQVDTDYIKGYSIKKVDCRIKWDDEEPDTVTFNIKGDSLDLPFSDKYGEFFINLRSKSTLLIEIPWYDEGKVYFRYTLSGSTLALKEMNECAE